MGIVGLVAGVALGWQERGPEGVPTGRAIVAADRFANVAPAWGSRTNTPTIATSSADLGAVARETVRELREQRQLGSVLASPGLFGDLGVSLDQVLGTLDFVVQIAEEDAASPKKRLEDPAFVAAHFQVYAWKPDLEAATARKVTLSPDEIRLTSYLVYQVDGSDTKTGPYDTALYGLPDDECRDGAPLLRMTYTRQDVYGGLYEPQGAHAGRAPPLVYLTRIASNQALMQGSIEVRTGSGATARTRMFNVHENNGIAYDPAVKDGNLQRRFWYFREVKGILGVEQIPLRAGAAVAGDIYNVGLGKLVALEHGGVLELVILADTGGAFQPNVFQLDYLAGAFKDHAAFTAWERTRPSRVKAYILLKKPGSP